LTPLSADQPSLLARVTGVIIRPRSTFAAVVLRPQVAGVLAIVTAVSFAASAGFLATEVGRVALVDQWERTAFAFGLPVGDARYKELQELSRYAVPYAGVTSVARIPVAATVIAAAISAAFAARGHRVEFRQVMAVVAHASVILAFREIVAAPVNYARESLASPLTLTWLFGMLDEGSPVARFLSLADVFMLWWIAVLAIGVAVLYQMSIRRVVAGLLGVYLTITILLAGTMAVLGGNS
jgi:hypothetical protein